jgi:putative ABC transport system substrate-binding protein
MAIAERISRRRALRLLGVGGAGGALLAAGCTPRSRPPGPPRLGLLQYVRGAAPDAARRGFLQALARGGFRPPASLTLQERFAVALDVHSKK